MPQSTSLYLCIYVFKTFILPLLDYKFSKVKDYALFFIFYLICLKSITMLQGRKVLNENSPNDWKLEKQGDASNALNDFIIIEIRTQKKRVIPNFAWPAHISLLSFRPTEPTACWINISMSVLQGHIDPTCPAYPLYPLSPQYLLFLLVGLGNGSIIHPVTRVRNLGIMLISLLFLSPISIFKSTHFTLILIFTS